MQKFKKALKTAMGRAAGATGMYRLAFRRKMVVIAFHRVTDAYPDDVLSTTSARFRMFCEFFREHFRIVSLADQVRACRTPSPDMGRTLSITFDDGSLDNYEVAAPILRELGMPATFFLTTGFIGTDFVPYWDQHLKTRPGWMTWDNVRSLIATPGFDVGAHTETHLNMGIAHPQLIREELARSKVILEQELGRPVDLFAYPYGQRDAITPRAVALVKDGGYACCAGCYGGMNEVGADPFHLRRVGIHDWFETPHQLCVELMLRRS